MKAYYKQRNDLGCRESSAQLLLIEGNAYASNKCLKTSAKTCKSRLLLERIDAEIEHIEKERLRLIKEFLNVICCDLPQPTLLKSRTALDTYSRRALSFTCIEYLKTPLGTTELKDAPKTIGLSSFRDIMRQRASEYKEQKLDKTLLPRRSLPSVDTNTASSRTSHCCLPTKKP